MKETNRKMNKTKNQLFENITKVDKTVTKINWKKRGNKSYYVRKVK